MASFPEFKHGRVDSATAHALVLVAMRNRGDTRRKKVCDISAISQLFALRCPNGIIADLGRFVSDAPHPPRAPMASSVRLMGHNKFPPLISYVCDPSLVEERMRPTCRVDVADLAHLHVWILSLIGLDSHLIRDASHISQLSWPGGKD